jgi:origin recognition complex subunit 1
MGPKSNPRSNHRATKAERARRYLTGGGVAREDSDDELGLEDIPWQWIYATQENPAHDDLGNDDDDTGSTGNLDSNDESSSSSSRKRNIRRRKQAHSSKQIIGARMGSFECQIGDSVLLKAEGNNEAWVGLICDFVDDENDGMAAHFMWFSTEKEIRNKEKKRNDFLQVLVLPILFEY